MKMKKLAVLIVAFVLAFTTLTFAAETFDLSQYSLDQLVAWKNAVNAEIQKRLGEDEPFYSGLYEVGKDIKAGTYVITNIEPEEKTGSSGWVEYGIADENQTMLMHDYIYAGASCTVNLSDGQFFRVASEGPKMTIRLVENPTWAP